MSKPRIRYFVAPHQNRGGGISDRCWDVRELVQDEFGIEHDQGKVETFRKKKDADRDAERRNRRLFE
jgi:hypothetical protein